MRIFIAVVVMCGMAGISYTAESITVPADPSFSEFVEAYDNDNDLFEELKSRATRLCAGLEFPRDTFAINNAFTILVAHTPEGSGLVLRGNTRVEAGSDIQLGSLTLEKRGDLRVLTHYAPSGESITCVLDEPSSELSQEEDDEQTADQPGGTIYSPGEEIPTLPTGFWTPDVTSGGSFALAGGTVTIELRNGGYIEEDGITYTCSTDDGCKIVNRRVTKGMVQVAGAEESVNGDSQQTEVSASVVSPLTETTLDESVVTLTLKEHTYEQDISKIRDALSVSGINGVAIDPATVQRLSDTEIMVALTFNGTDFDADATLTFTVASGALADYTGDAFTTEVPVSAIKEEDINGDGIVNIQDLVLAASNLGEIGQNPADVNGDGQVNIQDLVLIAGAL